jgi:trk system potassium uptake protein TrkA
MYVVLVGGGQIGRYIARDLAASGNEVTVIERYAQRLEKLVIDTDVLVIEGDACDLRYLEQAHVDRADVFVATTHDDDVNLVSCQLAQIEYGVRRIISRVNSPKNVEIFTALGIEPVSSTQLISELIENEFSVGELIRLTSLRGGRVQLVEVRIPEDPGPPVRQVQHLNLPTDTVLVTIFRGSDTVIPAGGTEIRPGDHVIAITSPEHQEALRERLLGTP